MTNRIESTSKIEFPVLLAAGIFYAAGAYVPWGWPSVDGYPAIERYIDPQFLRADFYTNTSAGYTVDTILAICLGWVQSTLGVKYDVMLAALNLIRMIVWPFALFRFFLALGGDRRAALIGVLLGSASLFSLPNLFAWGWLWGDPSTALFSILFIVMGWTEFLSRRAPAGLALFTLALVIHPLMAVHGGIFAALIFFFDYSRDEKIRVLKEPLAWAAGAVFAGVFLFQYLLLGGAPDQQLPARDYAEILAWTRHPTDYLPSKFSTADIIAGFSASATGALIFLCLRGRLKRSRLMLSALASYAVLCLLGWIFVEIVPIRFFVELIPFRYVIVGAPIILFLYGAMAAEDLSEKRWTAFAVMAAAFGAAGVLARTEAANAALSVGLLLWAAFRVLIRRIEFRPVDDLIGKLFTEKRLLAAIAIGLIAIAPAVVWKRRHELVIPRMANQHAFYEWASAETATDAVFLIDQYGAGAFSNALDPQRVRLVARRAVVASKDFPFLDRDMIEWNDRWRAALGGGAPRFVSKASPDALEEIATSYPYDYVVRDAPLDDARFEIVNAFAPDGGVREVFVYRRIK